MIYSIHEKSFTKSKVKCPGRRGGFVFKINDNKQDELTVVRYIKLQWNKNKIDNHLVPPLHSIKLINGYILLISMIGILHKVIIGELMYLIFKLLFVSVYQCES